LGRSPRPLRVPQAGSRRGHHVGRSFDNIDHDFLLKTLGEAPGRELVRQWLRAGVMEEGAFHATEAGTPQGGVINCEVSDLLEPYEVKVSSTVLRGGGVATPLPYPGTSASPTNRRSGRKGSASIPSRTPFLGHPGTDEEDGR
jgi:hypothetical protein